MPVHWIKGLELSDESFPISKTDSNSSSASSASSSSRAALPASYPDFYIATTRDGLGLPCQSRNQFSVEKINPVVVVSRLLEGLQGAPVSVNAPVSQILSDADEAFLIRHYVEAVAPTMTIFSLEMSYTHVIPWIAMNERVVLDSIIAISCISLGLQSPGLLARETSRLYKERAVKEVYKCIDTTTALPRKLMYLWCYICMLLHDVLTNSSENTEPRFHYGYQKLREVSSYCQPSISPNEIGSGPRNLLIFCVCLFYTLDIGLHNRSGTSSVMDPDFIDAVATCELEPRPYSSQWWVVRIHILLGRVQIFAYTQNVPTLEESQKNSRLQEWKALLADLIEYERTLPQTLRPYAVTQRHPAFSFENIHVSDESALLAGILFHAAFIWLYHLQPDLTPDEQCVVPPASVSHAYAILGLLSCCERP